jgi:S-adenosylmethionine/arginine decarboxylase-like enzyme
MASHHFLGSGLLARAFRAAASDPDEFLGQLERRVRDSGLAAVARQAVPFPDGGLTAVLVLAESHLVIHHWAEEGYATIDLHICDYRGSNAAKARRLVASLRRFCFVDGSDRWQEHQLESPRARPSEGAAATAAAAPRLQSTDN